MQSTAVPEPGAADSALPSVETASGRRIRLFKQTLIIMSVCLTFTVFAVSSGWINPALSDMSRDQTNVYGTAMILEPWEADMLGSLVAVGMIPGAWLGGWMGTRIGRRHSLMILQVPVVLGWILIALACNPVMIHVVSKVFMLISQKPKDYNISPQSNWIATPEILTIATKKTPTPLNSALSCRREEEEPEEEAEENKATHRYFPPVVGKLKYLKEVQNRVSNNIKLFFELKHPVVSSEEGAALLKQWQEVEAGLDASMRTVVDEWKVIASADYTGPLSQPLLHRCQDNTLAVNFSPEQFTYLSRLDLLLEELKQVRQTDGVFRLDDRPLEDASKQFNHLPL
ncbi:uncharacterized protein LOC125025533 [Penaeus chinensis]|uniref:uncharacterized protein LOC125025533 n=1 Tax=Penaeus chinensis TaxID=139456 RepID=UPI001FB73BB7|nr:uncharacterized protein LOC125025533 [Penaeus chinensis]